LKQTVQNIPFLRITIALAVGIVIGSNFFIGQKFCLAVLASILVFLVIINKNYKYSFNLFFGFGIQSFFVFLGVVITQQFNKKPAVFDKGQFIAVILETPQEKPNSYKSILQIEAVNTSDSIWQTKELVTAYFSKSNSISSLNSGDIIVFDNPPQTIENKNNPYEFDYKNYLAQKRIYRQVYLAENHWAKTNRTKKSVAIWAEQTREKLLQIYRNQPIDETEFEILSALTLGYKRELEPETKRVFSASGASHVLAVSGLHVGIVFYLVSLVFGFLRYKKNGRLLFMVISILILWSFAFLTGLSPSVMRAAAMFSIFTIGENLARRSNIYNSMAASAFILLLINPNNLYDIGFQLSYAAVFGIVFLQPKLEKLIFVRNRFLRFFWMLITVSISAQIATFPITSFYFGQFPTYFWITNTFVIPAVMALIPLGILLFFVSTIPVVSSVLAFLLNVIIKITYFLLSTIYQLPFSVFDISIGQIQFILLIATVGSLFIFLKNRKAYFVKTALISMLAVLSIALAKNVYRLNHSKLIVYHTGKNTDIHLIHGKINYIITNDSVTNDEKWFHPGNITSRKLGLNHPKFISSNCFFMDQNILLENGLIFFEGKSLSISRNLSDLNKNKLPDFIINPAFIDLKNIDFKQNTTLITNISFFNESRANINKIHNTTIQGAFIKNW
jgi:competence protein ComEC